MDAEMMNSVTLFHLREMSVKLGQAEVLGMVEEWEIPAGRSSV